MSLTLTRFSHKVHSQGCFVQVLSCADCVLYKFNSVPKQSSSAKNIYAVNLQARTVAAYVCQEGCLMYVSRNARLEPKMHS